MKVVTIIGTRPEIIKMSPLLELFDSSFDHLIIHSGQHYSPLLDKKILKELKLPKIKYRLKTGSGNFSQQMSKQMKGIFKILESEKPNLVVVQGDTNTALSGALVATRLKIKVVHVEAGCRSGNLNAPEEQNRLVIDAISTLLFSSDSNSYKNLIKEGNSKKAYLVGSTTFDAIKRSIRLAPENVCKKFDLVSGKFVLATLHRAENLADLKNFKRKIKFINWISKQIPVVFPVHPRTEKFIKEHKIKLEPGVIRMPPLTHLPFVSLLKDCRLVVSDSGGIQEEAVFFNRPCLVLRQETEWMRLIEAKKNYLLKKLSIEDYELARKLIFEDKFYKSVQMKKSPESKIGAAAKIIKILKKVKC